MYSNKALRRLLLPLMADQILMSLMGLADTIMVSNVSAASLSAVSLVDAINVLVLYLFAALATGGTVVCAQYIGTGDKNAAGNAARQLMMAVLALSLVLSVVSIAFRGGLLRLIFGAVDDDVMAAAKSYYLITAMSYPCIALYNASASLFRAAGNSRLPMLVTLGTNVINIAVNAALIFGFRLGVEGAALSTLISRAAGTAALLVLQRRPGQDITLEKVLAYRPDMKIIRKILFVGIPAGIENCLFQLGKLMVHSTVSLLGTTAIAVQALTNTLEAFQSMPGIAIGLGLVTVAGTCMGAGKPEEARRYTLKLTALTYVVLAASILIVLVLTRPATVLSGMDAQSAGMTFSLMAFIAVFKVILWPMAFTPANGLRAAGDVKYAMLVSVASMWVFRVGLGYFLCRYTGAGLYGVWIAMFTDWLCRGVLFLVRLLRGAWMQNRLLT
jgi:putative MATE family efflux protein